MKKASLVGIAALAAVGFILASQRGNAETIDESFDTTFVVVLPRSDQRTVTVLKQPTHKVKCRREFLVGECVGDADWRAGKTVWIAIDEIAEIKSAEEFQGAEPEAPEAPVPVPPPKKRKS